MGNEQKKTNPNATQAPQKSSKRSVFRKPLDLTRETKRETTESLVRDRTGTLQQPVVETLNRNKEIRQIWEFLHNRGVFKLLPREQIISLAKMCYNGAVLITIESWLKSTKDIFADVLQTHPSKTPYQEFTELMDLWGGIKHQSESGTNKTIIDIVGSEDELKLERFLTRIKDGNFEIKQADLLIYDGQLEKQNKILLWAVVVLLLIITILGFVLILS